jgi:orotate phosphoribosyltransferase
LNVRGAFTVSDPGAVAGKHVLVIDDILTTGATARAVAKTLIDAGAESVWVATLARARRIHQFHGSSHFDADADADERTNHAGDEPAATLHEESIHSSQDQPSF